MKSLKNKEYRFYDGEVYITLDVVYVDEERSKITIASTDKGKISVFDYEIMNDKYGSFIEYGPLYERIDLDEFKEIY